jgi:hypothetical protein
MPDAVLAGSGATLPTRLPAGDARKPATLSKPKPITERTSEPAESCLGVVEAAGIERCPSIFEKRRRRATFVVNLVKSKGFGSNSLSP